MFFACSVPAKMRSGMFLEPPGILKIRRVDRLVAGLLNGTVQMYRLDLSCHPGDWNPWEVDLRYGKMVCFLFGGNSPL